ncbi:MAG: DNA-binding response regulator [Spirochaetaceae bacterium]|nr:MAG: DNA-binding response regulator [Spirochaetaceae bacterium]
MDKTRVLLVDDQVLFVQSLKIVIESLADDLTVCGIALNGEEAIAMANTHHPDLILMDIRMPVVDGVEAAREILRQHPSILIIMLTTFDDDEYVAHAIDIGAVGYLLKDRPPDSLIAAMYAVLKGGTLITPAIAKRVIRSYREPRDKRNGEDSQWDSILTKREIQLLERLSSGLSNKEISGEMNLAEQTVKNYISLIYSKIGIHSRYSLILKAKTYFEGQKDISGNAAE